MLTGNSVHATGTNVGASLEAGESYYSQGNRTVWWKWTAPSDGVLTVDTIGSSFDTVLAVYSGAEAAAFKDLVPLASNDNADGKPTSKVACPVKAGTWLFLQVGGKGKARGNVVLNYTLGD